MNQSSDNNTILHAEQLHKHYRMGSEDLHVLRGVDVSVKHGEWLCILGASGSGKSTLLHLLGGLDTPSEGGVTFNGEDLFSYSAAKRDRFRNAHVGFVFQFYHLLPELNVLENTIISGMVGRSMLGGFGARTSMRQRGSELLESLGLGERLKHRPKQLSGGERQRVAIARALINQPDVLLADEPTGNLDRDTGQRILDLLQGLHKNGQTMVMVTHDATVADRADRVLKLERGRLVHD